MGVSGVAVDEKSLMINWLFTERRTLAPGAPEPAKPIEETLKDLIAGDRRLNLACPDRRKA